MTLETVVDEVMPKLHPHWKHLLLKESLGKMNGREVARRILRERGRTDVKVCLREDERDCYSPFLNLVGLSEKVAGSYSVVAVAIAAHEVGHALQLKAIEKFGRNLKSSSILALMSSWGEMLLMVPMLVKNFLPIRDYIQEQYSTQGNEVHQPQKKLNLYRSINFLRLSQLPMVLLKWFITLLVFPIYFGFTVIVGAVIIIISLLAICCAFISRWLVFLTEIDASLIALRLLKQYEVLDIEQQKAARKFLLACALTYLRSPALDRVFA
jgi:Zn-dependent membrane protease YugP